jgi:hypothetical protein
MKHNTYYFTHDYNARNDRKLVKVRLKHRQAGVGIYWSLVEMLYEEGGKMLISDTSLIAVELREKEVAVRSVINDFGLFESDEQYFWSNSVKRRLDKRLEKSEKAKESAAHRWQNANAMRTDSDGNAIKERKGKEIKGKKRRESPPPVLEDVVKYFLEGGYTEEAAVKAYNTYAKNDWHDTKGNKVLNWKSKMINVWFKPENERQSAPVKKMIL